MHCVPCACRLLTWAPRAQTEYQMLKEMRKEAAATAAMYENPTKEHIVFHLFSWLVITTMLISHFVGVCVCARERVSKKSTRCITNILHISYILFCNALIVLICFCASHSPRSLISTAHTHSQCAMQFLYFAWFYIYIFDSSRLTTHLFKKGQSKCK